MQNRDIILPFLLKRVGLYSSRSIVPNPNDSLYFSSFWLARAKCNAFLIKGAYQANVRAARARTRTLMRIHNWLSVRMPTPTWHPQDVPLWVTATSCLPPHKPVAMVLSCEGSACWSLSWKRPSAPTRANSFTWDDQLKAMKRFPSASWDTLDLSYYPRRCRHADSCCFFWMCALTARKKGRQNL